jgi:hypothetical protein
MFRKLCKHILLLVVVWAGSLRLPDIASAQPWYDGFRPNYTPGDRWLAGPGCNAVPPAPIYFSADFMVLDRSDVDPRDFMFRIADGAPVMATGDVDQPTAFTTRYNLIFQDHSGWDLHFELFGLPDARDSRELQSDPGGLTFNWFGGGPLTPLDSYTVEYESRLRGGAVNMRWRAWPWLTLYGGFRYLGLHEDFDILDTDALATGDREGFFSGTENDLFGGQVGGEFLALTFRGCQLTLGGAYGVYANRMQVFATAEDGGGNLLVLDRRHTRRSMVGEVSAMLEIPVCSPGMLRIGYQAYWITDVLLATDQADDLNLATGTGAFDYSSPFYQGGFVGFEVCF